MQPSQYIVPTTALPGGALQPADQRLLSLSTVCIILGAVEILYALYGIGTSTFSLLMMRSWAGSTASPSHNPTYDLMQRHLEITLMVEIGRLLPFLIASAALIVIAIRLRRGDARTLRAVRLWAWCALGVVVLPVLVKAGIIVPQSLELQRELTRPRSGGPSSSGNWAMAVIFSGILPAVVGAVIMSIWPAVLLYWTHKLERQLAAT